MKLTLKNATLSFPSLFTPETYQGQNPRFRADVILNEDHVNAVKTTIHKVVADVAGDKAEAVIKRLQTDAKRFPLRDGDNKVNSDGEIYAGYEGKQYVAASAKENKPPKLYSRYKGVEPKEVDFFSGAEADVILDVWFQDNKWGKAVNITLLGVRATGGGTPLGGSGASASEDDFDFEEQPASDIDDDIPW